MRVIFNVLYEAIHLYNQANSSAFASARSPPRPRSRRSTCSRFKIHLLRDPWLRGTEKQGGNIHLMMLNLFLRKRGALALTQYSLSSCMTEHKLSQWIARAPTLAVSPPFSFRHTYGYITHACPHINFPLPIAFNCKAIALPSRHYTYSKNLRFII
jgi:hypothetical protein